MFTIAGLSPAPFAHLFGKSDEALAAHNAKRYDADAVPGFPCRVSLEDAAIGEPVLLVNFEHLAEQTPYRASHAIFVREGAVQATCAPDTVPAMVRARLISVRALDARGWMLDADVVEGANVEQSIARFFADDATAYIHLHFAKRGCFAARVDREAP